MFLDLAHPQSERQRGTAWQKRGQQQFGGLKIVSVPEETLLAVSKTAKLLHTAEIQAKRSSFGGMQWQSFFFF